MRSGWPTSGCLAVLVSNNVLTPQPDDPGLGQCLTLLLYYTTSFLVPLATICILYSPHHFLRQAVVNALDEIHMSIHVYTTIRTLLLNARSTAWLRAHLVPVRVAMQCPLMGSRMEKTG